MIGTIKNDNNYVIGLVEWHLLNAQGQFGGKAEYIYVADIWIHEAQRRSFVFQELIRIIDEHPFAKDAKYVYWDFVRINGGRITDETLPSFDDFKKQSRIYDRRYIADKILKREGAKCSL